MLLAVDVGNTTTRFGLFADGGDAPGDVRTAPEDTQTGLDILGMWEVTTPERLTADEARLVASQALTALEGADGAKAGVDATTGRLSAILSCVVPSLEGAWTRALAGLCGARPLVVGPGLKTGMKLDYDDPSEIGPDRIADAVAARERYGAPVIIVDLGTTTNIEVVDAKGAFAGGLIAPGLALGARSLSDAAARLPMVELRAPKRVIGKSTREAMRAGVVLGEAARIDGLLDMVEQELAAPAQIVLTGDAEAAPALAAILRHEVMVDDALTLRGLALLARRHFRK